MVDRGVTSILEEYLAVSPRQYLIKRNVSRTNHSQFIFFDMRSLFVFNQHDEPACWLGNSVTESMIMGQKASGNDFLLNAEVYFTLAHI